MRIEGHTSIFSELKTGYGIICSEDGWILTCSNIVCSIENIVVKRKNKESFQVGLFHYDEDLDLAILKPTETPVFDKPHSEPSKFKSLQYLSLNKFVDEKNTFCDPAIIITHEGNIVSSEGLICCEESKNGVNITKLEFCCAKATCPTEISGCPIIAKIGGVLGMVNLSLKTNSSNSILGIAADMIKPYLRSVEKIWSQASERLRPLVYNYIPMLMHYRVNDKESRYHIYFDKFNDLILELQEITPKWIQMITEVSSVRQKVAPSNSFNIEIHFLVKPKSFLEKNRTIYEISEIIHHNVSEKFSALTFIDTSSVYIFEQLKWFLIWNSLLKTNEDKIKNIQEGDEVIDVLHISQLITEEEYMMVKQADSINKSVAKFIEVLSSRYPSDIDFIVAELRKKKLGEVANIYNDLKISTMKLADPFRSAKESSLTGAEEIASSFASSSLAAEVSSLLRYE